MYFVQKSIRCKHAECLSSINSHTKIKVIMMNIIIWYEWSESNDNYEYKKDICWYSVHYMIHIEISFMNFLCHSQSKFLYFTYYVFWVISSSNVLSGMQLRLPKIEYRWIDNQLEMRLIKGISVCLKNTSHNVYVLWFIANY